MFGWPSLGPFRQNVLTESIIDLKHALKSIGLFPWETSENTLSALKTIQKYGFEFRIIMLLLGYYEQCEHGTLIEFANLGVFYRVCLGSYISEKMNVSTLSLVSGFEKVKKNMQIKGIATINKANGIKHDLEDAVLKPNPEIDLIMPGGNRRSQPF